MRNSPKVALINDTSLYSRHFGCQLVGQTIREQLKRVGLDLSISLPKEFDLSKFRKSLMDVDLVIINGEGSIHHGRNTHLIELANEFPSVLLNCVYQENPPCSALEKFLFITAREHRSAEEIQKSGIECSVVPDLLFGSSLAWSFQKQEPLHETGVTDSVIKVYNMIGPFKFKVKPDIVAHDHTPGSMLKKISSFRQISTGRFHIAALASILQTPFNTWESNTWKIRGMLEDMGAPELWHAKRDEALASIPTHTNQKCYAYSLQARVKIEETFNRVRSVIA